MIPIKDAITIFEQHKIEQLRNSDFLKFESGFFTEDFSALNYIIGSTKQLQLKPLLSFLKKRYFNVLDEFKTPITTKGLALYGKQVRYVEGKPYCDHGYEEIYKWYFYSDKKSKNKFDFKTGECTFVASDAVKEAEKHKMPTDLFENYDYEEIYNPSINYTVMGSIKDNLIVYMDICVDNEEFKTFLESKFKKKDKL